MVRVWSVSIRSDINRCRVNLFGTVFSPGFSFWCLYPPGGATMRVSVWFLASCALICCALRLIEGGNEQRQCSEVRDATVDQYVSSCVSASAFVARQWYNGWVQLEKTHRLVCCCEHADCQLSSDHMKYD